MQALREKLAGLSKYNPWLAQALAKANNVSEHLDLESAAKAAAVIETLDEIADEGLHGYEAARLAMFATTASARSSARRQRHIGKSMPRCTSAPRQAPSPPATFA